MSQGLGILIVHNGVYMVSREPGEDDEDGSVAATSKRCEHVGQGRIQEFQNQIF